MNVRNRKRPYVERPKLESQLRAALEAGQHIVLYGPPGSGKSTLIQRLLDRDRYTLIDVDSDTRMSDIYRLFIMDHGVPILSQAKKTRKGKASATISWLAGKLTGDGELINEATYQQLEIDLKNPVDIGRLLDRMETKIGVVNNAHLLSDGQLYTLAANLNYFYEGTNLQFVVCGNWIKRDRLQNIFPGLTGKVCEILVEGFTRAEFDSYVKLVCTNERLPAPDVLDAMYDYGEGDTSLLVLALNAVARDGGALDDRHHSGESASEALARFAGNRELSSFKSLLHEIGAERRYRCYAHRPSGASPTDSPADPAGDDLRDRYVEFNLAAWTMYYIVANAAAIEKQSVEIAHLAAWLRERLAFAGADLDIRVLTKQLKRLESLDSNSNFYRRLFELTEESRKLTVIDRRFWKFLSGLSDDDYANEFEDELETSFAFGYRIRDTRIIA